MRYTELLQLWDEAVQAVDVKDWTRALDKLQQITEPTSRTLFNTASAHLALGHLDPALKVRYSCSRQDPPVRQDRFCCSQELMWSDPLHGWIHQT